MPFVAIYLRFVYVNKALLYKQIQIGHQLFLTHDGPVCCDFGSFMKIMNKLGDSETKVFTLLSYYYKQTQVNINTFLVPK